MNNLSDMIKTARGLSRADLFVTNCRVINVFSGEIVSASFAVKDGYIVGFGEYEADEVLDLAGRWVCPGLIDGHVHIESSMLTPGEYARVVVPKGTTTVVADPHEIANVCGTAGIDYMLGASEGLPLNVYVMLPSCVPATDMETSGAALQAEDIKPYLNHPRVLGLAELMNFPGVLNAHEEVLRKLHITQGKPVDGHAPGLKGRDLSAYVLAGIGSDHECITPQEALEKLRLGMRIMIRQGSAAQNLENLLPFVTPANARRCIFVSDDRHPGDILTQGHLDYMVRTAIIRGIDPVTAIQMATLNTAEWFGLREAGALAPGYRADFIVLDDLNTFAIDAVYTRGNKAAQKDFPLFEAKPYLDEKVLNTVNMGDFARNSLEEKLKIPAEGQEAYAIRLIPGEIVTQKAVVRPSVVKGCFTADPHQDVAKLAVIERHKASGRVGLGLVQGFGLSKGAIASSVTHDSHNIIAAGMNDGDMAIAVEALAEAGGGIAIAVDGKVTGLLPLPVAGLMSDRRAAEIEEELKSLHKQAKELGIKEPIDPFMTLSFLALPVIPSLKLTDHGLMDFDTWRIISVNCKNS